MVIWSTRKLLIKLNRFEWVEHVFMLLFLCENLWSTHMFGQNRLSIDYSNGDSGSYQDSIRNIYADLNSECL